jgi:ABC-type phosphate transport system substrate-binding protein
MTMKLTMLAVAYLLVGGFLMAVSYQSGGPVTTQKTDRVAGSTFLIERFAG